MLQCVHRKSCNAVIQLTRNPPPSHYLTPALPLRPSRTSISTSIPAVPASPPSSVSQLSLSQHHPYNTDRIQPHPVHIRREPSTTTHRCFSRANRSLSRLSFAPFFWASRSACALKSILSRLRLGARRSTIGSKAWLAYVDRGELRDCVKRLDVITLLGERARCLPWWQKAILKASCSSHSLGDS